MEAMDLMTSDADKMTSDQLHKSQCTYLCEIIKNAFEINAKATALSKQEDSGLHRERNSDDTNHPSPDRQLDPGNPGEETLEPHDNKKSAEWRELCFAIEHAQVLVRRCCNENVLEAAIMQTDLTEEISTLVSFFFEADVVASSDYKTKLENKCKEDNHALKEVLKAKEQELKEGVLAAYLLERFYDVNSSSGVSSTSSVNAEKGNHRPTRSNKWSVDPSELGSAGQRLGKGASGFIYETTWLGEKFTRKFFLGTNNPGFEAEASALVDLRHLNIVHTFCWAKDRRSYSLVLEKFGTDLHTYVQKKKEAERKIIIAQQNVGQQQSSSTQESLLHLKDHLAPFGDKTWLLPAVRIMLQIATGMKYLHEKKVAHGDLEPNNILVKPVVNPLEVIHHLHVKVVDFGLTRTRWWRAQYCGQEGKERDAVGFRWKAPEQFKESTTNDPSLEDKDSLEELEPSNEKIQELRLADVYIFATICLYILTGELPVTESESKDGLPPYKLPHDSGCPKLLELLQRCWTAVPKERPSFAEICNELQVIQTELMPKFERVGESHLIHVNLSYTIRLCKADGS